MLITSRQRFLVNQSILLTFTGTRTGTCTGTTNLVGVVNLSLSILQFTENRVTAENFGLEIFCSVSQKKYRGALSSHHTHYALCSRTRVYHGTCTRVLEHSSIAIRTRGLQYCAAAAKLSPGPVSILVIPDDTRKKTQTIPAVPGRLSAKFR